MILNLLNSDQAFNLLIIILFLLFKRLKSFNFKEMLKLQYICLALTLAVVLIQPFIQVSFHLSS